MNTFLVFPQINAECAFGHSAGMNAI